MLKIHMEAFLDLLKALILFVVIILATSPICSRMDKIISQLENSIIVKELGWEK